jgi:endonuclease YncB( thermonuclease family)
MSRLGLVGRTGIVVALLAVSACTPDDVIPPATTAVEGAPAVVTWVYDGDTIEVEQDGRVFDVRLDGINAPERGECYHQEATSHLIDTLKGREITLVVTGEDQFDRVLAMVWDGDMWVNRDLVATGMAIATTDPDRDSALVDAETDAYGDGLGLWGACGTGPTPAVEIRTVVFDPPGPDDEVLDEEYVVLLNSGDTAVELGGWVLRDESSRHRHHFDAVRIDPGETFVVTSGDDGWDPGASPVWSNDGDMALLIDPGGRIVARYRY